MTNLQPFFSTEVFPYRFFDVPDFDRILNTQTSAQPAYNVSEVDDGFLISVDLPGTKKEDLKIEVVERTLTVTGQRKRNTEEVFSRSFSLPESLDSEKIQANYEDGVLELFVPRAEKAKPRQIEIQAGKSGFFDKLLGSKKNISDSPTRPS